MPTQTFPAPATFIVAVSAPTGGTVPGGSPPSGTVAEAPSAGVAFTVGGGPHAVFVGSGPVPGAGVSANTIAWTMGNLAQAGKGLVPVALAPGAVVFVQRGGWTQADGTSLPYDAIGVSDGLSLVVGVPVDPAWYSGLHRFALTIPTGEPATPDTTLLWVDGQQQVLAQLKAAATLQAPAIPWVGTQPAPSWSGYHLHGDLADLYWWNRALTGPEVLEDLQGYAPSDGLVAAWPFNDGAGVVAANLVSGSPALTDQVGSYGVTGDPLWL